MKNSRKCGGCPLLVSPFLEESRRAFHNVEQALAPGKMGFSTSTSPPLIMDLSSYPRGQRAPQMSLAIFGHAVGTNFAGHRRLRTSVASPQLAPGRPAATSTDQAADFTRGPGARQTGTRDGQKGQ